MHNPDRASCLSWLWALLPLLLAAALVIPLLDEDAYNGDEPKSVYVAGALPAGPHTLADVWQAVEQYSPEQALGWPMLLFAWGRLVGWSELAVRTLSFFSGVLALAWVFRTGCDLFAFRTGFIAELLLSVSVLFLAFMVHARVFMLVALFTTISLWSYWRLALRPQPPDWRAAAGLLLGATGLLWSHYFGALLLPALALFHLLFVRKQRRWWQPVLLFGASILLALPQLPVFLRGLGRTAGKEDLHSRALSATAVLSGLARSLTNGLVDLAPPVDGLLLFSLLLVLALVTLLRLRTGNWNSAAWLVVFVSAALLALKVAVNELLKVIVDNRIRYLMPFWPLTALLVGAGLWHFSNRHRHLVTGLLLFWLVTGAWLSSASGLRYELGYFFRSDLNHFYAAMSERIPGTDLLILDLPAAKLDGRRLYTRLLELSWDTIQRDRNDPFASIRPVHEDYPFVWLLYLSKHRDIMAEMLRELGRVFCQRVLDEQVTDKNRLTLELYALHSAANCPQLPLRLEFEKDIQLTAPEIAILDGRLRLDAHLRSEDDYVLSQYSFAVHLIDTHTDQRVSQTDTGAGPGAIVPLRSEIDISALPPGDYEVRVALYNWQSGERLTARDVVADEVSDMHTLHSFRIG